MRKLVFFFSLVFNFLSYTLYAQSTGTPAKPSGSGTEESPYHITTADELLYFAAVVNGNVSSIAQNQGAYAVLDDDIDLSGVCGAGKGSWTPIGYGKSKFTGVFDGHNHTISNIYISGGNVPGMGLFGKMTNAEIKNVTLGSGSISSYEECVGGIVGIGTGKIVNCHNYADVTSSNKFNGGIIGYMGKDSYIERCHNEGKINSTTSDKSLFGVGGIAGAASANTIITDCYNIGSITGMSSRVGGVVGSAEDCIITNCFSYGDVESTVDDYGGGLYGYSYSKTKVENSYYYNRWTSSNEQPELKLSKSAFNNGEVFDLLSAKSPKVWQQKSGKYPIYVDDVDPITTYKKEYTDLCEGDGIEFDGQILREAGTYIAGNSPSGGDTLVINVIKPSTYAFEKTIVDGEAYVFGIEILTEAGVYTETIKGGSANGCDSIVTLTLEVVPPVFDKVNESICEGDSIEFDGQYFRVAGTYIVGNSPFGGDTLVLSVSKQGKSEIEMTIVKGDEYLFGGQSLTEAGVYTDVVEGGAESGCDSIVTLHLNVVEKDSVGSTIQPFVFFSPNDDGIEDTWTIKNIESYPEAKVYVYNRWGKLLFETEGYQNETNAWDGTYKNTKCPSADYWYIIDIESLDMQLKGHLTLVR